MALLEVKNLTVKYSGCPVIEDVCFSLNEGEVLGIAGESGCGKTTILKAVLGILPQSAKVTGSVQFRGSELIGMRERAFAPLRGNALSMVFQDPSAALNPIRKIKHQFYDIIGTRGTKRRTADDDIIRLLSQVHLPEPEALLDRYPSQLSGGMKQRVVIAMSICKSPCLLMADEPTSALDTEIRLQIIDELIALQKYLGFAMIYISHNLAELSKVADSIIIMKSGAILEHRKTAELFAGPEHDYTRELIKAAE